MFTIVFRDSSLYPKQLYLFCLLWFRVANLAFLKPEFQNLEIKKARENLAFSGFFQSERLGSGKTLSELHIH